MATEFARSQHTHPWRAGPKNDMVSLFIIPSTQRFTGRLALSMRRWRCGSVMRESLSFRVLVQFHFLIALVLIHISLVISSTPGSTRQEGEFVTPPESAK
jgi:hypothetical protein